MELRDAIARVCGGGELSELEMAETFGRIMDGGATPSQIGALLVGLRMRGETVAEVVGAARAMRARAARVEAPAGILVDTCGTGGDGAATINVSTIAALVVAAAGVRVAKHGNRAVSSRAGSADLLEALGVDLEAPPSLVARCLAEVGIGFFFAPAWHGATRHANPVRREIGVRTVFNLLGPLTNPAGARHQVVGVYQASLVEPVARALGSLGAARALVVHGAGGLDELSPSGTSVVAELFDDGRVACRSIGAADFGLEERPIEGLAGGSADDNARIARAVLDGEEGTSGSPRTAVLMTAAATLYVAGAVADLREGTRRAAHAIDSGAARRTLARLVEVSRGAAGTDGSSTE